LGGKRSDFQPAGRLLEGHGEAPRTTGLEKIMEREPSCALLFFPPKALPGPPTFSAGLRAAFGQASLPGPVLE